MILSKLNMLICALTIAATPFFDRRGEDVKFCRKCEVGQKYVLVVDFFSYAFVKDQNWLPSSGVVQNGVTSNRFVMSGVAEVIAIDENNVASELLITVDTFLWTNSEHEAESFPKNEHNQKQIKLVRKKGLTKVKDAGLGLTKSSEIALSNLLEDLLGEAFVNPGTEYYENYSKDGGGRWPVAKTSQLANSLTFFSGDEIEAKKIDGSVQLADLSKLSGVPCHELLSNITFKSGASTRQIESTDGLSTVLSKRSGTETFRMLVPEEQGKPYLRSSRTRECEVVHKYSDGSLDGHMIAEKRIEKIQISISPNKD